MGMIDELTNAVLAVSGTGAQWLDAFGLAYKLGVELQPVSRPGVTLVDRATHDYDVEYDDSQPRELQQSLVAYGISQWALREWGMLAPDAVVRALAHRLVQLPKLNTEQELRLGLASA